MKRYSTIMSVLLTLALPVAGSCAEAPKAPEKTDASAASAAAKESKPGGGMAQMPGGGNMNPSGKVVETMDGGGYTYANIESKGQKTWVAYPTQETKVGETLSFSGCMNMTGFQSRALNRKFDTILFCGSPTASSTGSAAAPKKAAGSTGAVSTAPKNIKVEKATGANAYTVDEIYAKSAALNGKQVVVKGQVVKVSAGIMGKNWIHLQDGTGDAAKKTHDITVTSDELPKVGEVVTMSGTLAKDKDFGGGYKYNAILENGRVQK